MEKDNDYYRTLDLHDLATTVPRDKAARGHNAAYHEMLIALALRCQSEPFTSADLLAYLGEPDAIKKGEHEDVWEYFWSDEHCAREYHSATPFLVKEDRVLGIQRHHLTPAS